MNMRRFIFFIIYFASLGASANEAIYGKLYEEGSYKDLFQLIYPRAKIGDSDAQLYLSRLIRLNLIPESENVDKDSYYWLFQSASRANIEAFYELGYVNYALEKNYEKSALYFDKAYKAGHIKSGYMLGLMHYSGNGVAKNYEKAFQYLTEAMSKGNLDSAVTLGNMFLFGNYVGKDKDISLNLFKYAEQNASGETLYEARQALQNYYSEKNNEDKLLVEYWRYRKESVLVELVQKFMDDGFVKHAFKKMIDIANTGNRYAMLSVWKYYKQMDLKKEELGDALKWLKLSSDKHFFKAQAMLASYYFHGEYGINKNIKMSNKLAINSIPLLQYLAKIGDAEEQYNLAVFYYYGIGVEKDLEKSNYWNKKALESGYSLANKLDELLHEYKNKNYKTKKLKFK